MSDRRRPQSFDDPLDLRLVAALAAAKVASTGIRRVGRGGGTAAPGLVADRIDPRAADKLAARLPRGAIVVAGTNGKTTTSRMIADILERTVRGWSTTAPAPIWCGASRPRSPTQAGCCGRPGGDIGVIETDEAAFPEIVRLVRPRVILLNNLFRDQLDRYGELNTIATRWSAALARLPASDHLVVNADDPALAAITRGRGAPRRDVRPGREQLPAATRCRTPPMRRPAAAAGPTWSTTRSTSRTSATGAARAAARPGPRCDVAGSGDRVAAASNRFASRSIGARERCRCDSKSACRGSTTPTTPSRRRPWRARSGCRTRRSRRRLQSFEPRSAGSSA